MRGEQAERLPGWLRVTLGSAGDVVLFAALSLLIWTVLPAIALRAAPVIISGGSMAPLVRTGDVVLLDDTPPPDGELFAAGTVITFERADGPRVGELVTHRVAGIDDGHYVTRGDANEVDDPRLVHPDQLVGAGRWLVPRIGLPAHWARSGDWHLVLATALAGAAAIAASITGRHRVVIEEAGELDDDRTVDTPLEPAHPVLAFQLELEDVDAPAAANDPSQDEHLESSQDERMEPSQDGRMEPAAARRAATVAVQAARRGLAGVDRSRQDRGEPRRAARRRDRTGGSSSEGSGDPAGSAGSADSAGSAPVAAIVALALALLVSTIAPTFAASAFATTASNPDNAFTVADHDLAVDVEIYDDWGSGFCAETTVSTTSTTPVPWQVDVGLSTWPVRGTPYSIWDVHPDWTFAWPTLSVRNPDDYNTTTVAGDPATFGFCADRPAATQITLPVENSEWGDIVPPNNTEFESSWQLGPLIEPLAIHGEVEVQLDLRASTPPSSQNVDRYLTIDLLVDGVTAASSGQVSVPFHEDWDTHLFALAPTLDEELPAGTSLELRVTSYRYDLREGGPSWVRLPG